MSSCVLSVGAVRRPATTVRPVPALTRGRRPTRPTRRSRRPGGAPRLTRRGRVLLVLLMALVTSAAFGAGRASVQAATEPAPALLSVTVQPGETLWEIAARVAPQADRRETVARLSRLNDLPGGRLRAGQRLVVPPGTRGDGDGLPRG